MSKPKRIQRSRAKGWKMPANAIYVGRPTVWGNPYVVGSELMSGETLTAEKAVVSYEQHLADNFSERDIRHCLHDKDLACWCALDEPCHADVLLRIANSRPKSSAQIFANAQNARRCSPVSSFIPTALYCEKTRSGFSDLEKDITFASPL